MEPMRDDPPFEAQDGGVMATLTTTMRVRELEHRLVDNEVTCRVHLVGGHDDTATLTVPRDVIETLVGYMTEDGSGVTFPPRVTFPLVTVTIEVQDAFPEEAA